MFERTKGRTRAATVVQVRVVGGPHGYTEFLRAIRDGRHPDHAQLLQWAGGTFDPDAFNPTAVLFDNPKERWENAFRATRGKGR